MHLLDLSHFVFVLRQFRNRHFTRNIGIVWVHVGGFNTLKFSYFFIFLASATTLYIHELVLQSAQLSAFITAAALSSVPLWDWIISNDLNKTFVSFHYLKVDVISNRHHDILIRTFLINLYLIYYCLKNNISISLLIADQWIINKERIYMIKIFQIFVYVFWRTQTRML